MNRLALVAVLASAAPALAETPLPPKKKQPDPPPPPSPPDPIVEQAKNANLESTARHQGVNVTLAVGGGFTLGFGIDNAVNRGFTGNLRIATVASDNLAFTFEAVSLTLLHRLKTDMGEAPIKRDQDSNVLIGLQYYVNRTLWLRVAGGLGAYAIADTRKPLAGPAGLASGGVDVVRTQRFALGLEFLSIAMVNRDGVLSSNAFLLALNFE